jgi:hypothetical protein
MNGVSTHTCSEQFITTVAAVQKDGTYRLLRLIEELAASEAAERQRAANLADALDLARAELALVRSQCQAAMEAARVAAASEASARQELPRLRDQFQQIVDTQTLQLLELTRELTVNTPARPDARPDVSTPDELCFAAIETALAASPL